MSLFRTSTSLLLLTFFLSGCAAPPKVVEQAQNAPSTAPAADSASTPGGIAVGHGSTASAVATAASVPGPIKWTAPSKWEAKPASGMRAATYLIPAAQGDPEGAECAVFLNIAGGVDANIKRWIAQFEQPDGGSSEAKAKQKKETINDLAVTTVDLTGTFKGGGPMMGMPQPAGGPKNGYRLLGAIVETPDGEVFFKMTGPAKTMGAAQTDFQTMLKSIKK
jgi:hypothetical protein